MRSYAPHTRNVSERVHERTLAVSEEVLAPDYVCQCQTMPADEHLLISYVQCLHQTYRVADCENVS